MSAITRNNPPGSSVHSWHLADMLFTLTNVCFWVESGHDFLIAKCLLMTQNGHSTFTHLPPVK